MCLLLLSMDNSKTNKNMCVTFWNCLNSAVPAHHPAFTTCSFFLVLGPFGNLSMLRSLLLSLVILFCIVGGAQSTETLQRLNYGVVFPTRSAQLSNEYWLHTFKVPLSAALHLPSIGKCHKNTDTCMLIGHVLAQINTVRAETSARLNDALETVYRLIPQSAHIKGRGKRSLLPFLGQLSRSIFGTATVDDINVLSRHINELSRRTMKISNAKEQPGAHHSELLGQFRESDLGCNTQYSMMT